MEAPIGLAVAYAFCGRMEKSNSSTEFISNWVLSRSSLCCIFAFSFLTDCLNLKISHPMRHAAGRQKEFFENGGASFWPSNGPISNWREKEKPAQSQLFEDAPREASVATAASYKS